MACGIGGTRVGGIAAGGGTAVDVLGIIGCGGGGGIFSGDGVVGGITRVGGVPKGIGAVMLADPGIGGVGNAMVVGPLE